MPLPEARIQAWVIGREEIVRSIRAEGCGEEEGDARKGCPRCGLPIAYIKERERGGRIYVYAVHYLGKKGRRSIYRECYLGPRGSYEYVPRLHEREGLMLRGPATDGERIVEYARKIAENALSIDTAAVSLVKLVEMRLRIRGTIKTFREALEKLEEADEELSRAIEERLEMCKEAET